MTDPLRARRARAAHLAAVGRRVDYGCLGVAIAVFAAGAATGFTPVVVWVVVACLATATVTLAPAIVVGYGVRAAEREDPSG